jgi:hypothetical protein
MQDQGQGKEKTIVVHVHYESEQKTHPFESDDSWAVVHTWACEKFDIANDVCPNLEFRDGSSTGSVLGENVVIGPTPKQRTVWLVKPGPDQYGRP